MEKTIKKGNLYWRKKGCELVKRIKRNSINHCEICGRGGDFKRESHHILSVGAYPNMANQIENIIVICVHCHKFGKISFHGNPQLMKDIFDQKFPGRYKKLLQMSNARKGKAEYEEEHKNLLNL